MYSTYFGLTEKPFAISPDPRYLCMSEIHREALAHLVYGINSDGCIVLLTGDVGTGKTTVCRCFFNQIPENTDVAAILNPQLTIVELLKTICEEFGIDVSNSATSIKEYTDQLNKYLLKSHGRGRISVVIVDEAQNLGAEVLEQLRLLTNLETDTHKLLKVVLVGQPELRDILQRPGLSQINQRITTRYHLRPLPKNYLKQYIEHRISVAGGRARNTIFTDAAIRYIGTKAQGVPRLINVICDRAMLGAYAINSSKVTRHIAQQAAREVITDLRSSQEGNTKRKYLVWTIILFLLVLIAAAMFLKTGGTLGNLANFSHSPVSSQMEEPPADEKYSEPSPDTQGQ